MKELNRENVEWRKEKSFLCRQHRLFATRQADRGACASLPLMFYKWRSFRKTRMTLRLARVMAVSRTSCLSCLPGLEGRVATAVCSAVKTFASSEGQPQVSFLEDQAGWSPRREMAREREDHWPEHVIGRDCWNGAPATILCTFTICSNCCLI
jgi:hypothetical protein